MAIHLELSTRYKDQEQADDVEWLSATGKMPAPSKQTVLQRACQAYEGCNHVRAIEWHKKLCYTNALDGSEDGLISHELLPFWHSAELNMPATREALRMELTAARDAGEISEWCEIARMLEPYDAHRALQEGMEGFHDYIEDSDEESAGDVGADAAASGVRS